MLIYDGPSLLDGQPIIVVAIPDYSKKVGQMLLTWIILRDVDPRVAAYNGADASICGDCKYRARETVDHDTYDAWSMRPDVGERACYVRPHLEPWIVWTKFHDDEYPDATRGKGTWKKRVNPHRLPVRLGSYGDPAAVPYGVWARLVDTADRYTGYTHMWDRPDIDLKLQRLCMASVDSFEERDRAQAAGWRTFLVVPEADANHMASLNEWYDDTRGYHPPDILCPASKLGGGKTTCDRCRLCMGNGINARSIWIPAHGPGKQFVEVENFSGS